MSTLRLLLFHRPPFVLPSVPVFQLDNVDHPVPHLPTIAMKYQNDCRLYCY